MVARPRVCQAVENQQGAKYAKGAKDWGASPNDPARRYPGLRGTFRGLAIRAPKKLRAPWRLGRFSNRSVVAEKVLDLRVQGDRDLVEAGNRGGGFGAFDLGEQR